MGFQGQFDHRNWGGGDWSSFIVNGFRWKTRWKIQQLWISPFSVQSSTLFSLKTLTLSYLSIFSSGFYLLSLCLISLFFPIILWFGVSITVCEFSVSLFVSLFRWWVFVVSSPFCAWKYAVTIISKLWVWLCVSTCECVCLSQFSSELCTYSLGVFCVYVVFVCIYVWFHPKNGGVCLSYVLWVWVYIPWVNSIMGKKREWG